MTDMIKYLIILGFLAACYLLGSVNTAVILSKTVMKTDVRNVGSGNAGTTNMMRSGGFKLGALTFIGDFAKGAVAVVLGKYLLYYIVGNESCITGSFSCMIQSSAVLGYLCGIACIIGHVFPAFFGFKGGKGVATTLGVMLFCNWFSAVIALSIFIVIVLMSKIVSLGSIFAALSVPVLTALKLFFISGGRYDTAECIVLTVLSAIPSLILILKHKDNIKRLLKGEEKQLSFGKSKS